MGFHFRRSKIGPVRITASKKGVSYSVGGKGFRVTKRADGSVQETISVPGTGISYTKNISKGKGKRSGAKPTAGADSGINIVWVAIGLIFFGALLFGHH